VTQVGVVPEKLGRDARVLRRAVRCWRAALDLAILPLETGSSKLMSLLASHEQRQHD